MDVFKSLPGVKRYLERMEERLQGRFCRVMESTGQMVKVSLPVHDDQGLRWDDPIGPFPSSFPVYNGASKITYGYLMPLRGGRYLFIPHGLGEVISFGAVKQEAQATSTTGSYVSYLTASVTVPEQGYYRLGANLRGTLGKSTNSGTIYLRPYVNGGSRAGYAYMSSPILNIATRTELGTHWDEVLGAGVGGSTFTVDARFTHTGAAGTVTMYQASIDAFVQKIG